MEMTASEKPKKLEPASPIKVLAGLKLNGKNPASAPAKAVIISMAIIGEPFKEKIINSDKQDINEIPEESPSNPSIRLIAFVIPTIHPKVSMVEKMWFNSVNPSSSKKGMLICSILIPLFITITAATICATSFTNAGKPFTSSIKQVIIMTKAPSKNPANLIL